jgi:general secretion pathway protein D
LNNRILTTLTALALLCTLLTPLSATAAKGVVLNFSDVDISTMVKFISDLTGRNFILDDKVKGKISVYSPAKLSPDEAFNLFTSVLELKGFTLVQRGKVYKIVPTATAKQEGLKVFTSAEKAPVNESYIAHIVTLENISAQDALAFLQPTVSKDGHLSVFGPSNMLLMVDSAVNIQKNLTLIRLIDTPQRRDNAEVIYLKHAAPDGVAAIVKEWLANRDRASTPAGRPVVPSNAVVADTRLNAVVVFGTANDKEEIRKLVTLVDVAPPVSTNKVNVYFLEYADATEIAKVLETMLKGMPAPGQPGQPATPAQQSPFEGGKITITPDKGTNSLIVMASPTDYLNLMEVIRKLDRKRRQVFVSAVIAEISLDRLKDIGVQTVLAGGGITGTTAVAGIYDPFNFVSSQAGSAQNLVFQVLNGLATNSNAQFGATVRALEQKNVLNVLSTPTIMTSDNKEAEIFVGENVPFISSSNLSSTGLSQQSIERKDTGITLRITPQITEGEYVKLDIYQEISAVKDALNRGAAADITTTKRSAKTSVLVKNDETVVIGGLIQDQESKSLNKVPILGDIPLFGWLFKTRSTTRQKTNLMILLTPRIVKGPEEMSTISRDQKGRFSDAVSSDRPMDLNRVLSTANPDGSDHPAVAPPAGP